MIRIGNMIIFSERKDMMNAVKEGGGIEYWVGGMRSTDGDWFYEDGTKMMPVTKSF